MFLLGVMHDIGYEFVEHVADHAYVGGEILKQSNYQYWQEISQHGNIAVENMSDELFILNCADMTTGPNGEDFTFEERIEEIANCCEYSSMPHKKCITEVKRLKKDKRFLLM